MTGRPERPESRITTEFCRGCGAVYRVTLRHLPAREHDWYHCAVCGRLMGDWTSTRLPTYAFVRPGSDIPPRKPR